MFLNVLIGMAGLLALIGLALTIGYALNRAGALENVGRDKTEIKAAVVASREAVRRRVAETRRTH